MKSLKLVTSALIACAAIFLSFTLTNHEEEIDNSVQEKNLTGSWIMEHSNSNYHRLFIFQDNGLFQTVLTEDYKMTKSELEILLQPSPKGLYSIEDNQLKLSFPNLATAIVYPTEYGFNSINLSIKWNSDTEFESVYLEHSIQNFMCFKKLTE